ncbi:NAD+ synthase [Pseudidiomarina andamanensis]|uniref:Glutamine-dependent NAD(+) synthetase n=1 Tax=Pseudidiomarina andamanensis TaxID=1940690 RepID=A0AA92ET88_9GAMM|nr:NAD+ synthase [Pseudidiomarina andamanensis]MDS0219649.1 NAD+ synthase [Pseudidiomarina andamanensis]QGT95726.1 NAD+ synthase [Pseudidiomarina andamanensis]
MKPITITLAQLDFTVGAITRNTESIIATLQQYADSDLVIFPELAITGYPPEDLLFRDDLEQLVYQALDKIAAAADTNLAIVGHPQRVGDELYNSVSVLHKGKCLARYHKQRLPQYGVFDEQRYFIPGHDNGIFTWQGHRIGLLICEDLWHAAPLASLASENIDLVISLNASPYEVEKHQQRLHILQQRVSETRIPIVYVNNCGGQDELVFDGHSLVMDAKGELVAELPHCQTACASVRADSNGLQLLDSQFKPHEQSLLAEIYQALVLAVRDYVTKNGFKGVTLGLSGGIDSAVTMAIAVDALGADKVHAIMMPFRYTSQMSQDDAAEQARRMGVKYDVVAIEPMYDAFMQQLEPLFAGTEKDTTEENLQARARGTLLMAVSNKTRSLVLTTGNKSELAVGYCTLYGDMNGGFAPIKDVPKTLVFELARFRNLKQEVIPERVITRPPSAELAPDQKDQDSLPPYDVLDRILTLYVEQDWSPNAIIDCGFDEADVLRVVRLVDINEYKRRQGAVGPKITARNFGKDRRYPITNHFRYELERQVQARSSHEKN